MPRSQYGGRHELGQNFITHQPTIKRIARLVGATSGSILEIGAGGGAITRALVPLQRPITALELDEHFVRKLKRTLPTVRVVHGDVMRSKITANVVVGNLPFHLTTPIIRRLLQTQSWQHCILIVQWEVARKRAGVGGATMLTAQNAPWFEFGLEGRIPARCFQPSPTIDGGLLTISRRTNPLVDPRRRREYDEFVRRVFTGRGATMPKILARVAHCSIPQARHSLNAVEVEVNALPRDLTPNQWAGLWQLLIE